MSRMGCCNTVCAVALAWLGCGQAAAVEFDSSYTRLASACAALPGHDEDSGSDPLLDCPGPGGFHLRIGFSAADAHLNLLHGGADSELLLEQGIAGIDQAATVVEWRLADRRPFALIVRSRPVVFDDQGQARPGPIETLEVRGLQPGKRFVHSVSVRGPAGVTPHANVRARALADASYAGADPAQ